VGLGAALLLAAACRTSAPATPPATPAVAAATPAPPVVPPATAKSPAPAAGTTAASEPPLPDVDLRPAGATPPPGRILSLAVASPAALADALDRLAQATGIDAAVGQGFLDSFDGTSGMSVIGGVPVTRAMLDRLDPARPITGVGLMPGIGVPGGLCVAATFRDAAGARRTLAEIGPELRRTGGVSTRRLRPDKDAPTKEASVFAGVSGRTLLLSSAEGTLMHAGALAIAMQATPPTDQAVVTLHVDALGPAGRGILQGALAKGMTEVADRMRKDPKNRLSPAIMKAVEALGTMGMRPLAEVRSLRLALDVGADAGVALRLDVDPIPGSGLSRWATPSPYRLDPALPIGDDGTMVLSWGAVETGFSLIEEMAAPTGPAGRALRKDLEAFAPSFARGGSCVIDVAKLPLRSYCAWDLKPGLKPAGVLDRYAAVIKSSHAWSMELVPRGPGAPRIRRARDVLEIEEPLGSADDDAATRAMRKIAFGGDTRRSAVTVKGGRLIVTQGPTARDLLPAVARDAAAAGAAASAPASAPILTDMLARTKGSDAIFFVDLVSALVRIAEAATDPSVRQVGVMLAAVPGLATLRMPLVLSMRSNGAVAYELTLPRASVENAVRVIRPFMGTMGGAMGGKAAPGAAGGPGVTP
jgi:hypothetical protein